MNEAAYREAELAFWGLYGVEPKEHHVQLSTLGTTVRVQEAGTGDPVLFLHGSPTSGTTFAPLAAALRDHRCLVPDLPPGGLSGPYRLTSADAPLMLRHLALEILDAVGVERAHLVASSSGSAFAMYAATEAPERIGRIVHLGAPWLIDGMPVPVGDKLLLMPGVGRLMAGWTPGRRMQMSMHKSIGHAKGIDTGRIPRQYWDWYDALMASTGTYADQMRLIPAFKGRGLDYEAALKLGDGALRAQPATLVIWGADEKLASEADARAVVDRIPESALEVVADAGHLPWLDFPDRVAASARRFFEGVE